MKSSPGRQFPARSQSKVFLYNASHRFCCSALHIQTTLLRSLSPPQCSGTSYFSGIEACIFFLFLISLIVELKPFLLSELSYWLCFISALKLAINILEKQFPNKQYISVRSSQSWLKITRLQACITNVVQFYVPARLNLSEAILMSVNSLLKSSWG